jgi:hypothetical protein
LKEEIEHATYIVVGKKEKPEARSRRAAKLYGGGLREEELLKTDGGTVNWRSFAA